MVAISPGSAIVHSMMKTKSKTKLPVVMYRLVERTTGRDFFVVVASESPLWIVGDTFTDDDMSMASRQVQFKE